MVTIYDINEGEVKETISEQKPVYSKTADVASIVKPRRRVEFSEYTKRFLDSFEIKLTESGDDQGPTIRVSEVLGRLARLYEKIRTTVEYKGEHVLRRNAIERILKRLVWEKESVRTDLDNRKVAESLIKELIWARYLPNNFLPEKKIDQVEKTIDKYLYFIKNLDNPPKDSSSVKVRNWIWGVASSELEDIVDPSYREVYVKLMYEWFTDYFDWEDTRFSKHDKEVQVYLAIHRAFTKSDDPIMRYHLLLKEFPNWQSADRGQVNKLILTFPKIYSEIEEHLNFPGRFVLFRRLQKSAAAFDIFREIASEQESSLRKLLANKQKFEETVRIVCEKKYKQVRQRVNTGIVRSIIYIFVTKVLFALILEIPYEVIFLEEVRYLPLLINLVIPPSMMWIIGLSISIPGARNTELIIQKLNSLVYETVDKQKISFSIEKAQVNTPQKTLFGAVYSLLFALVFGSITYLLTILNFTIIGILIFFVFLSLVILFAFRVRFNANQLKVETESEGLIAHLTSYLTLPFLNFGFYLSKALSRLNFMTIILDFLIEVPLKNIIEVFEEWTSFIREKKEEVVELPE